MDRDSALSNFGPVEINGYIVWQDVPILAIISMLAYFCFLEQLLVGKLGSNAIAISLPFSCVLALLGSMTSSFMVTRRFAWVYASIQFVLVVLFAHILYSLVRSTCMKVEKFWDNYKNHPRGLGYLQNKP